MLENALGSIEVGVEDFELSSPARVASAVRNLHAGVLLLCKEKLRQMSPEGSDDALIYAAFEPVLEDGEVVIKGRGKTTVGVDDIIKRFDSLGLKLDFKDVRRLTDIRNNIEHRAPVHSVAVMREAIAATTAVVTQLLKDHLGVTPAEVLSERAWQRMLKEAATQRELRKSCDNSIDKLDGAMEIVKQALKTDAVCPACDSTLVEALTPYPSQFRCQSCGEISGAEPIVVAALDAAHGITMHERIKDGESPAIERCPTCDEEAFIVAEDCCALCDEGRPYKECDRCGESLSMMEQDLEGYCSYCDHMANKDD